jgi:hypothetical protein
MDDLNPLQAGDTGDDENNDESRTPPQLPQPSVNGLNAFDTVREFLEGDDWHPHRLGEKYIYHVQFSGRNAQQNGYAIIRTDLEQFLFYAVAPVKAPEEVRNAVAEFITRANYGLRIGNFEMDYSDGEIRYKSSLDFEGVELTTALIRMTIYPAVQTMDRYMPGLMRVIYGGRTPVEAILEVEHGGDSDS